MRFMEQILAGVFEMDPTQRDAFLSARVELARRSRQEPGCVDYVFAPDPLEAGRVILFERWESEEALAEHRRGLASNPPEDPGIALLRSQVQQFAVTEVHRL